jgi:hypothetical protein
MSECEFTRNCESFLATPKSTCQITSPSSTARVLRAKLPNSVLSDTWVLTNVTTNECSKSFFYRNGVITCFNVVSGKCKATLGTINSTTDQFISVPKSHVLISKNISDPPYLRLSTIVSKTPRTIIFDTLVNDVCLVYPDRLTASNGTVFQHSSTIPGRFRIDGEFTGNPVWHNLTCSGNGWNGTEHCLNTLNVTIQGTISAATTTVPTTLSTAVLVILLWIMISMRV